MCFMPRRPPRSRKLRTRWNLSGEAPIRNTTKSPSISADILRPAVLATALLLPVCLCLVRHRTRYRITAFAAASDDAGRPEDWPEAFPVIGCPRCRRRHAVALRRRTPSDARSCTSAAFISKAAISAVLDLPNAHLVPRELQLSLRHPPPGSVALVQHILPTTVQPAWKWFVSDVEKQARRG